jgi:rhodanese-related sulfurtransferase
VRNADSLFHRLGGSVLILGKLIPGVAAVAIPTAAASGMRYSRFLAYDAVGAALWSGIWVGAGTIFGREVDRLLDTLETMGNRVTWWVVGAIALWVLVKAVQRQRLKRLYRARRIAADDVAEMLRADAPLVILDVRSELAWSDDPRALPRAVRVETPEMAASVAEDFRGHTLVSFCTCPNEASAAVVAQKLIAAGFGDVRILAGGTAALDLLAPLA